MNVLMFSPGFPAEMPYFTRGLARVGVRILGLGDQPVEMLPDAARESLSDYLRVRNLFDEGGVIEEVQQWASRVQIDRVECLWEPGMILAARLREALGLPGMTVEETVPFRDKERMKQMLDDAGIRTPRHRRASTEDEVREGVEHIGYPVCIKPIAGAGSADTYRVGDEQELEDILTRITHVPEVSVEEFIEGEEFTFDTICSGGARALPQRRLVPTAAAERPLRGVDQPPDHQSAGARCGAPGTRHRDGPRGAQSPRIPHRLHPHGVVPER